MQIRKLLLKLFVCVLSVCFSCTVSFADADLPTESIADATTEIIDTVPTDEVKDKTNWFNIDIIGKFTQNLKADVKKFEPKINIKSKEFVPIEARIGLMFMKALSSIDYIFQISLVRFVVIFLFLMYAVFIGLSAYKMIEQSTDYKTVLYNIVKRGVILAVWVLILYYGPAKIFSAVISPILALAAYLSNFILDTVANNYNVDIPDTCAAIHNYIDANNVADKMLIDSNAAANIMCVPSRISVFFYHAVATGFKWMIDGFGNSATMVIVGIVSIVVFIKCAFKYAFMTLGVVADLFLTLLMLPFTAVAETLPAAPDGKSIIGRIYEAFMTLFKTKKLPAVFATFVNAAIYFVGLSIIIAICAALLSNIISVTGNNEYVIGSVVTTILAGCAVLYLANQTDKLAKQLGGEINNSFGEKLQKEAKTLWKDAKKITSDIAQKVFKK